MKYAVVRNGVVENLVEWDGIAEWEPPAGTKVYPFSGPVSIGWNWNGGAPVNPAPPPAPSPPVPAMTVDQKLSMIGLTKADIKDIAANGAVPK